MTEYLESIAKIGLYSALLLIIGAQAATWLVRATSGRDGHELLQRIARVGIIAGTAMVALLLFRLWAHTAAAFGVADATTSWRSLSLIAFESRWGGSWRAQMMASVASLLVTAWAAGRHGRWVALAPGVAAAALVGTFPLMGHAAGQPYRVAVDALHLLGGGVWLGTLAVLVVARAGDSLFGRFSPLALSGAAIAASSGLVMAWIYVGTFGNLWTTPYGRLLIGKLAVLLAVAGCGYVNWRRLRAQQPPAVARLEVGLALAVVVITAFLTETAHP